MCRWRGIEAAAVCEVYNLIRVPHGRPQNTECSSRGRDRPLLRPHIAALIIRLYRITLAYHRREYETRRVRIDTFSLSLPKPTHRGFFWSRAFILDLFWFDSSFLFFSLEKLVQIPFRTRKKIFRTDFGLILRKKCTENQRNISFN